MNPPPVGEFCWNELVSTDAAGSAAFYSRLFGWGAETEEMAPGRTYTLSKRGGVQAGGLMAATAPGVPSHWVPYVTVTDCDASAAEAVGLGALVCVPPTDISVGRIAVLRDPQGAVFGLFQLRAA